MRTKWMIAALAALGLALASLPFIPMMSGGGTSLAPGSATASCDAKASPADLSFSLKDMDGNDVKLADYKGKVILLNFWATWCGPCKLEIPAFVELQEKYREQGVVFLGLSVDDPVEKVKPFAAEYKMNYPVLIGEGREDVQDAFGPMWGIPVTVMIGRDGRICKKQMGIATKDEFERDIMALL